MPPVPMTARVMTSLGGVYPGPPQTCLGTMSGADSAARERFVNSRRVMLFEERDDAIGHDLPVGDVNYRNGPSRFRGWASAGEILFDLEVAQPEAAHLAAERFQPAGELVIARVPGRIGARKLDK